MDSARNFPEEKSPGMEVSHLLLYSNPPILIVEGRIDQHGSFEMSDSERFRRIYLPGNSRFTALRPSACRSSENPTISHFSGGVGTLPNLYAFPDKARRFHILGSRSLTNCSRRYSTHWRCSPKLLCDQNTFRLLRKGNPVGWY